MAHAYAMLRLGINYTGPSVPSYVSELADRLSCLLSWFNSSSDATFSGRRNTERSTSKGVPVRVNESTALGTSMPGTAQPDMMLSCPACLLSLVHSSGDVKSQGFYKVMTVCRLRGSLSLREFGSNIFCTLDHLPSSWLSDLDAGKRYWVRVSLIQAKRAQEANVG